MIYRIKQLVCSFYSINDGWECVLKEIHEHKKSV